MKRMYTVKHMATAILLNFYGNELVKESRHFFAYGKPLNLSQFP